MTISEFQYQVYWSFIASFLILGFSGVMLLRNSLRYRPRELAMFARGAGWLCCCLSFHGFFTTYLYVSFLRGEGAQLPLPAAVSIWVLSAPWLILRLRLLRLPERTAHLKLWGLGYAASYLLGLVSCDPSLPIARAHACGLCASILPLTSLLVLPRYFQAGKVRIGVTAILCGIAMPVLLLVTYAFGGGGILLQLLHNVAAALIPLVILAFCYATNQTPR